MSTLPFLSVAPAQAAAPNNIVSLAGGTWTVPEGVQVVQLIGTGARGGGTANGKKGGQGCRTFGSAVVTAGQTLAAVIGQPGSDGLTSGGSGGFAFAGGAGGAGAFPGGAGGRGYAGTNALNMEDSLSGGGGGGGATGITVNGVYRLVAAGGGGASPQLESRRSYQCYGSRNLYTNLGYGQGGLPSSGGIYQNGGSWASAKLSTAATYPGPAWGPTDYPTTTDGGYSNGATLGGYWYQKGANYYNPCGTNIGGPNTERFSRHGANGSLTGAGGAGADSGWYFQNKLDGGTCDGTQVILTRSPGGGGGGGWKGGGGGASGSSGSSAGAGGIGTNLTPATASLPPENYQGGNVPDPTLDFNFVDAYDTVALTYFTPDAVVKWATIDTDLPIAAETAGTAISQTLVASFGDGTAYSTAAWGWTATGLPSGWTLGATTGVLAGTVPATPADISVTATYKIGTKRVAQTTRTYHVGPAAPTTNVTVGSQTITYGETPASLVPALPSGTWTTAPTCGVYKADGTTLVTDEPIPAGTYVTKCTGGVASGGDAVTFTSGTLTVNQATTALTYTGTSGSVPAGETVTLSADVAPTACTGAPTYAISGPDGFTATSADGSSTWAVGTYTVTVTYPSDSNCSGATATATIEIVDASSAVTVTPDPESSTIEFGDTTPTFSFSTSDMGESSWLSGKEPTCGIFEAGTDTAVAATPIPAGTYDVVCSGGETDGGDTIVYTTGSLTVEKASTAIDYTGTQTGDGESITSGDPITLSADLVPDQCTGAVSYSITTPAGATTSETSPVTTRRWAPGTYTVTVDYTGDANCKAASTTATIVVDPAVVTVTPDPKSLTITYGDATPAFAPDTTGFLPWSGDPDTWVTEPTCTVTGSSPLPVTGSPYAVVCSGGDPGIGYIVDYVDGTLTVDKQTPTVAYTGTSGVITAGGSVTLSATKSPTACTGTVTYTINGSPATNPVNTSGWSGIYEVIATYGADSNCDGASDSATLIVGTPGDSTTGGGWYKLDSNTSASPRVNFGHTVQKVVQADKRTGTTTTTYRGQVLWINAQTWRMKGSVYSRTVTNTTTGVYVSGDTNPAFVKLSCPSFVGQSGSGFSCGMITGTGTLERYNADTGAWELASDIGVNGTVTFSATIYDGGQVKVCKNKTCSLTDLADYFGMAVKSDVGTGSVPSTTPIVLNNSRNGQIVIRSN